MSADCTYISDRSIPHACKVGSEDGLQPALEADALTLYWEHMEVVRNASLKVLPGELVCIIGRSGCGKTTLLHALAGLTQPTSGRVLVQGRDCTAHPGNVSYMLQKDLLIPSKTVIDNASLPLVIAGFKPKEARRQMADLFCKFGLEGYEDKWPSQLSGGMRQRAAFLRTYMMGNQVVLLDEPFSALDAITRVEMREWYRSVAREFNLASLVITHDVDEAIALADRVYVLAAPKNAKKSSESSSICFELVIERSCDMGFELTPEFLSYKAQLLAQL
ncbi:ABC transporter ATP-binding protein [Atopobium fossor]|uniref:ABC transporter ATP-binding protein n=1 Tax=Atopobium fossor TaxID=39487 RepID=UPI00041F4A11|nr:ABC transporter ATP-binding protein [Atopobium fossor]